jgi:hypothetical protein
MSAWDWLNTGDNFGNLYLATLYLIAAIFVVGDLKNHFCDAKL